MSCRSFFILSAFTSALAIAGCSRRDGEPAASRTFAVENVECPTPAEAEAALPSALAKAKAAKVGAVEGSFDVSDRGSATYTIPLVVPPGRAGVQPHLSVGYDSSAGEGTFGMGFNLQGFSVITRCGSNYAQDGTIRAVKYDTGDHFCLDGARLVQVAEHADGSIEYRTFPDEFSKVVAHHDAGWDAARGPVFFEVFAKSGRVFEYGNRDDGRVLVAGGVVSAWWVTQERDRRDNDIQYRYTNMLHDDGHTHRFYPDRIDYTGHPAAPANRRVRFDYTPWFRHPDAYTGGVRVMRDQRIIRVKMLIARPDREELVRVYKFNYAESTASGRALLESISECAREDDSQCKQPTTLTWLTNAGGALSAPVEAVDGDGGGLASEFEEVDNTVLADVNGDGLQDLVFEARPPVTLTMSTLVALNLGGTYAEPTTWLEFGHLGAGASVLDYNLDGREDILVTRPAALGDELEWTVMLSTGSSFEEFDTGLNTYSTTTTSSSSVCTNCWQECEGHLCSHDGECSFESCHSMCDTFSVPISYVTTDRVSRHHVLDLNGDGISDIAQCREELFCISSVSCDGVPAIDCDFLDEQWQVLMGMTGGFDSPATPPPLANKSCISDVKFVDLQGDGKVDILTPPSPYSGLFDFDYPPICDGVPCNYQLIEFEPDGTPIPALPPEGNWVSSDSGLIVHRLHEDTLFIDANGDGLVDAIQSDVGLLRTFLNTGAGFTGPIDSFDMAALVAVFPPDPVTPLPWTHAEISFERARPIDYDGDGNMDFVAPVGPIAGPAITPEVEDIRWIVFHSDWSGDGTFTPIDIGILNIEEEDLLVTDAQGDGRHDVLTRDGNDLLLRVNAERHGLLASVTDGMNALDPGDVGFIPNVSIAYGNLVDRAIQQGFASESVDEDEAVYVSNWTYQPNSCVYPRGCVTGPWPVVRAYSLADGVGGSRNFDLRYRNARYDHHGRGWLGFGAQIVRDTESLATTALFFDNLTFDFTHRVYPFVGQLKKQWSWIPALAAQPDPTQIAIIYTDVSNAVVSTNGDMSYFTHSEETEVQHYEADYAGGPPTVFQFVRDEAANVSDRVSHNIHQIDSIDEFGNVLAEHNQTIGLEETTFARTYINDDIGWLIGLLDSEEECNTVSGETQCQTSDPEINGFGEVIANSAGAPGDLQTQLATVFVRDQFGNVTNTSSDDAFRHHRSSCTTYDSNGIYPIASRNALSHTEYRRYDDGLGAVVAAADANALVTRIRIDGFGRIVGEERPDGTTTSVVRSRSKDGGPLGTWWNVKAVSMTTGGARATVRFDMLGRVVSEEARGPSVQACEDGVCTGNPRHIRTIQYDDHGRVARVSVPHLTVAPGPMPETEFTYDALGRRLDVFLPWGSSVSYSYDRLTTTYTDTAGSAVTEWDALGRPVSIADKKGTLTTYGYGPFDALRDVNVDGIHTSWSTDAYARARSENHPDHGTTERTYNGYGEIMTETDALGRLTTNYYDDIGRQFQRDDADGTTTWTYDPADCVGCLGSIEGPDGIINRYFYDSVSRPIRGDLDIAGEVLSTEMEYDTLGRPERLIYPRTPGGTGLIVEYGYDARGHVLSVTDVDTGVEYWKLDRVDGAGRSTREVFGNGVTTEREYDREMGTLAHIDTWRGVSHIQGLHYFYDERLNATLRSDVIQGAIEVFHYDELDRLVCASPQLKGACSLELTYQPNGNIEAKSDVGTYTYDPVRPHAVIQAGTRSYSYDAVGNQITRPGVSLIEYTAFDLPQRYTLDGGGEILFGYDGHHNRVRKVSPATETLYVPGLYERVTVPGGGGIIEERYNILAGDGRVVVTRVPGQPDEIDYVHTDGLRSTDVITDKFGVVKERHSFDAFGARRNPDWDDPTPGLPSEVTPFGYVGLEGDDELGLINMNGRIYDPEIGRFLQVDPVMSNLHFSQRWNPYSYVLNNPLSYSDPSGFSVVETGLTGAGDTPDEYSVSVTEHPPYLTPEGTSIQVIEVVIGPAGDQAQPVPLAPSRGTPTDEAHENLIDEIERMTNETAEPMLAEPDMSNWSSGGGGGVDTQPPPGAWTDEHQAEAEFRGVVIGGTIGTAILARIGGPVTGMALYARRLPAILAYGAALIKAVPSSVPSLATPDTQRKLSSTAAIISSHGNKIGACTSCPQLLPLGTRMANALAPIKAGMDSNMGPNVAHALRDKPGLLANAARGLWMQRAVYGHALEASAAESPLFKQLGLTHIGGPNAPDFMMRAYRMRVLVDITTFKGLESHLARPYYLSNPFIFLLYEMPL